MAWKGSDKGMALTHIPDPKRLILDGEQWAIVLNEDQSLLGRCFLLLKRPETDVTALMNEELSDLWEQARRVKRALEAEWEPDHFNYAFLMNVDPQVHFHIIPRYERRREFAGGTYADPEFGKHYGIGPARTLDPAAYDAIIATLKNRLR
jgi:diadenosine tetraphosphate (Ap4A) HIT family hydrolase